MVIRLQSIAPSSERRTLEGTAGAPSGATALVQDGGELDSARQIGRVVVSSFDGSHRRAALGRLVLLGAAEDGTDLTKGRENGHLEGHTAAIRIKPNNVIRK